MGLAAPVPGQALMSRAPAIWERRISEDREGGQGVVVEVVSFELSLDKGSRVCVKEQDRYRQRGPMG